MKKRIISIVLAAFMTLAVLCVPTIGVFAGFSENDYEVLRQKVDTSWLETHDNLLADSFCNIKSDYSGLKDSNKISYGSQNESLINLADGRFDTKLDLWSNNPVYITYNLGSIMPIKSFMFAGISDHTKAPRKFEIYVGNSEDKDSLFSEANKVVSYQKSNIDNSVSNWLFNFKDGQSPAGCCVGFLICLPDNNGQIQIAELGAYVDSDALGYTVKSETITEEWLNSNIGDNLLASSASLSISSESSMSGFYAVNEDENGETLSKLTDGNKSTRYDAWISNDATFSPVRITFDLGSARKLNRFFISGYAAAKSAPQEFEIYVSNSSSDIYNASNRILHFKNTDKHMFYMDQRHRSNWLFSLTDAAVKEGRYVGFRIIDPNEGNDFKNAIFIEELGAFSDFRYYAFSADGNTVTTEWVANNHKNNLLRYSECIVKNAEGSLKDAKGNSYSAENPAKLTDGEAYVKYAEGGDSSYKLWLNEYETINYTFDMMQTATIDRVMLASFYQSNCNNSIKYFSVFLSDSKDDLYSTKNQILYWDNTGKYVRESETHEGSHQLFTFTGELKPSGRYVGLSVLKDETKGAPCVLLEEFGVYADGVEPFNPALIPAYDYDTVEDVVNQDWVTEWHNKNLIAEAPCTVTDVEGNQADLSASDPLDKLTDGKVFVSGSENSMYAYWVSTPGVYRYTFDMKQTVTIDTVMFAGDYNNAVDVAPQEYAVYISDSLDDLYDPKNVAIVRDNTGKYKKNSEVYAGATQVFNFKGTKPVGRYVGFSIIKAQPGGSGFIRLQQLGVYADGVTPKSRFVDEIGAGTYGEYAYTVSRDITTPEYITQHMTENLIRYATPTITGENYRKLSDQIYDVFIALTDGRICESGSAYSNWFSEWQIICMTYNLGQTVPINRLMLISQYFLHGDYSNAEYEFYVSDEKDDLYDAKNRVVYFNNAGTYVKFDDVHCYGTRQLFEFTGDSVPVGRYVGLRLINPCPFELANLGTSEFHGLGLRIDELGIYSDGNMPLDALYSQTMKDSSGVTALIRKLDFEDTFKLGGVDVSTVPVSDEFSGYLKDHALAAVTLPYHFTFKKTDGSPATKDDLGGREIELRIPCDILNNEGNTYACQYIDGSLVNLSGYFDGEQLIVLVSSFEDLYILRDVFNETYSDLKSFEWDPIAELSKTLVVIDDTPEEITVTDTVYIDAGVDSSNSGVDTAGNGDTEADDSQNGESGVKKYKKVMVRVPKTTESSGISPMIIAAIIAGSVIVLAGACARVICIIKKKKAGRGL